MKNLRNSVVAKNASILMILQLSSYIVPFLLLPYLSRTLGVEGFGELAMLWSVSAYAQILIDFGFFLWATKECALVKDDRFALSSLWAVVSTIKSGISFLALFIMIAASFAFSAPMWLYLFMWLSIFAQALMPSWLFQGAQKVAPLLIFSLGAQVFAAIFTVVSVKSADDIIFVSLSAAISWLLFSIAANLYACKKFSLVFAKPSLDAIKNALQGAWYLFTVNVAVAFYNNLPAFILGVFGSRNELAVFVGAQKMVLAIQGLFTPVASAIFPRVAELTKKDADSANIFLKKAITFSVLGMGGIALFTFIFAEEIIAVVLGKEFGDSAMLLRIMSIGPVLVSVNTLLYSGYMVVRNLASNMKMFFLFLSIAALAVALLFVPTAKSVGASVLYVGIELSVFFGLIWKIRKMNNFGGGNATKQN